jgi:hypothetical protein
MPCKYLRGASVLAGRFKQLPRPAELSPQASSCGASLSRQARYAADEFATLFSRTWKLLIRQQDVLARDWLQPRQLLTTIVT